MSLVKQHRNVMSMALTVLGMLLISGCGTTQKTDFYQLNEVTNPVLTDVDKGHVIGIGPVQIAEYINRPQIITRNSTHQLHISEFHRWVEPLKDNINRMLVTNLSNHLKTNRVFGIPREERSYPLDLRITIDIRRFDGQLGKTAYLESYWIVFDKDDKPLLSKISVIEEAVNGASYEELVSAMNRALQTLGTELSQAANSILKP